jgi:hypothetical protein
VELLIVGTSSTEPGGSIDREAMHGGDERTEGAAELRVVDAVLERLARELAVSDEGGVLPHCDLEPRHGRRQGRAELRQQRRLGAHACGHLGPARKAEDPLAVHLVDDAVPAGLDRDDAVRLQRRHVLPQELDDIHCLGVSYSARRGTA